MEEMITENYCDSCDGVIHAVFNAEDFYNFKVGRIRCECGTVMVPCNECLDENGQHYKCSECPWKNAEIVDAMTDEDYVKWVKDNEPDMFKRFLDLSNGDYYRELAEKVIDESK